MSKSVDVTIIDTGICTERSAFQGIHIDGISFLYDNEKKIRKYKEFNDKSGHGTAVAGLILAGQENISAFVCKM